ncbi:MAG: exopolysaccharide biosynthesis protein [Pseudotabrizicola sp.]|uniref:exopolysaccharide biosynthesis protein n=1 Tax=Pseudotabrizicola sp. TaxID=2939647 RepID=UPI0027161043|nr:exopolysaccharide biosynthesis protein [Pseudotabrizicola sp.]MDO8884420.1 exopolysaccharide biosynthesis protein [Pseudotabrizicola sp.]MDP2081469.1 exopolysaccharide biosynthesis protein [Pseudotabrizicola sp.]MDZ7572982.1 exopolysaccharide biosynthesis protein [Pseudotabrizicola sp.]
MSPIRNQSGHGAEGSDEPAPGSDASLSDLSAIVSRMHAASRGVERVQLGDLVDAMGPSSMAAVLLVPALLLISPLSGVPGASIVGGLVIALIAGQIVLRKPKVWLPELIRARSLPGPALRRALAWLRKPARRFDGMAPARPGGGADSWWTPALAFLCLCLGLSMPMLELIPFSSSIVASLVAALATAMLTGRVRIALVAMAVAALAISGAFWLL